MNAQGLQERLRQVFAAECTDLVERLQQGLLRLEEAPSQELFQQMSRDLHTLKGSASAAGFPEIGRVAHKLEDSLESWRGEKRPERAEVDDFARSLAGLPELMSVMREEPTKVSPPSHPRPSREAAGIVSPPPSPAIFKAEDSIRVRTAKLEALQALASELVVVGLQHGSLHREIQAFRTELGGLQKDWWGFSNSLREHRASVDSNSWRSLESRFSSISNHIKGLNRLAYRLQTQSAAHAGHLGLVSDGLHQGVSHLRMLPVGPYLQSFAIPAREAARASGREVRVEIVESSIEVDRLVLERLREALVHLVRNAICHGLETPSERVALGKEATGRVTLEADREGEQVVMRVRDDGQGIDRVAVAKQAGLEPTELSDERLLQWICRAGFSTRLQVDELSGRGVGLDVVLGRVLDLRGTLSLETSPGAGSCFCLSVPASLATTQGLIVQVGPFHLGVPLDAVQRIVRIQKERLQHIQGQEVYLLDGDPVSVVSLARLLSCPEHSPRWDERAYPALVLSSGSNPLVVTVDDIHEEMPMVIKPLGRQFERLTHYSGGAVRSDGGVLPVLEPRVLVQLACQHTPAAAWETPLSPPVAPRGGKEGGVPVSPETRREDTVATIMVVDDSITTRTLERNILEGAGYRVISATDGMEALEMLREHKVDLLITDIDMPRMDGLELCRRIRAGATPHLPLIIVTSHGEEEEQRLGLEAGGDAYIVKSDFQQDQFLQAVRSLT